MSLSSNIGNNVRRFRKESSLTQEALAEKAKMDPKSIVDIENGKRNPTLKSLSKIAKALKTDIASLLS